MSSDLRKRRGVALTMCAVAIVAMTGCGSKKSSTANTPSIGTVTGTLFYVGGTAGTPAQPTTGEVDLTSNGKVIQSVTTDASTGGKFSLSGPFGKYSITAKAGTFPCLAADVTLGATAAKQDITCHGN